MISSRSWASSRTNLNWLTSSFLSFKSGKENSRLSASVALGGATVVLSSVLAAVVGLVVEKRLRPKKATRTIPSTTAKAILIGGVKIFLKEEKLNEGRERRL